MVFIKDAMHIDNKIFNHQTENLKCKTAYKKKNNKKCLHRPSVLTRREHKSKSCTTKSVCVRLNWISFLRGL